MFCTNCGKNIENAKFCPHCGKSSGNNSREPVQGNADGVIPFIVDKIKQKNYSLWIKIYSIIFAVVSIIVRFTNNAVETKYSFLAQDDFYVVSDGARTCLIFFMIVQILAFAFLFVDGKMKNIKITIGAVSLFIISLIIEFVLILLKFPAPY